MRKITSALALVGALGLFAACGDAGDGDPAPEGPTAPETVGVDLPDVDVPDTDAVVDAVEDMKEDAGAVAGDMDPAAFQTIELDIAGMT